MPTAPPRPIPNRIARRVRLIATLLFVLALPNAVGLLLLIASQSWGLGLIVFGTILQLRLGWMFASTARRNSRPPSMRPAQRY